MAKNEKPGFATVTSALSAQDETAIRKISDLARALTGVQLDERHKPMVASRLTKRLSDLGLGSFTEYLEYFHANKELESPKLIGLLTTHHTYFFREFSHFEFLRDKALAGLVEAAKKRPDKKIKIWIAACSRGQEAYSLAMFLDLHLKAIDPTVSYDILGSDIDPESVSIAKNGVYLRNELKEVPLSLLGDHWVKGTGDIEAYAKVKKSLRDKCRFEARNLLELRGGTDPQEKFDLVFCRNVFIYFNSDQIRSITRELISRLTPEGLLFIGISESLNGLGLDLASLGPSIYGFKAKVQAAPIASPKPAAAVALAPIAKPSIPRAVRVLCVDDSPSILTLLKQILSKAEGFEVVGVAKNGLEAAKMVSEVSPDIVTLDIHMPEQTGIEYLEKNFKKGHPPVVMITSVSRENADLAGRALTLGAADYVEKPALTNLAERSDEIRMKLRCAISAGASTPKEAMKLEKEFQSQQVVENPEKMLRVIALTLASRASLKKVLSELSGKQPPCVFLIEGAKDALASVAGILSKETGKSIRHLDKTPDVLAPNDMILLDFSSNAQNLAAKFKSMPVSILVFGDVSKGGAEKLLEFSGAQLVLEDLGGGVGAKALMDVASDVVLPTSFAYLSNEFFAAKSRKRAA